MICVACGKVLPRMHPGQFMCGDPSCRDKIVARMKEPPRELRRYHLVLSSTEGMIVEEPLPRIGDEIRVTKPREVKDAVQRMYVVESVRHDLIFDEKLYPYARHGTMPEVKVMRLK